jgi:hypothetical protein
LPKEIIGDAIVDRKRNHQPFDSRSVAALARCRPRPCELQFVRPQIEALATRGHDCIPGSRADVRETVFAGVLVSV